VENMSVEMKLKKSDECNHRCQRAWL